MQIKIYYLIEFDVSTVLKYDSIMQISKTNKFTTRIFNNTKIIQPKP